MGVRVHGQGLFLLLWCGAFSCFWLASLALVTHIPRGEGAGGGPWLGQLCLVGAGTVESWLPRCHCMLSTGPRVDTPLHPPPTLPPRCSSPGQPSPPSHLPTLQVPRPLSSPLLPCAGISSWFSLVPIPGGMQAQMLLLAGAAFAAGTAIERGARAAFPAAIPPEKGGLLRPQGGRAALRRKED